VLEKNEDAALGQCIAPTIHIQAPILTHEGLILCDHKEDGHLIIESQFVTNQGQILVDQFKGHMDRAWEQTGGLSVKRGFKIHVPIFDLKEKSDFVVGGDAHFDTVHTWKSQGNVSIKGKLWGRG